MMKTIDGDRRLPSEIAEELGFSGSQIDESELKQRVDEVLAANK